MCRPPRQIDERLGPIRIRLEQIHHGQHAILEAAGAATFDRLPEEQRMHGHVGCALGSGDGRTDAVDFLSWRGCGCCARLLGIIRDRRAIRIRETVHFTLGHGGDEGGSGRREGGSVGRVE